MLDRLLNNRKEWNALKEVHEAKVAAIEAAKKEKEEAAGAAAAAKQGGGGHWSVCGERTCELRLTPFLPSCSECSPVKDMRSLLARSPSSGARTLLRLQTLASSDHARTNLAGLSP